MNLKIGNDTPLDLDLGKPNQYTCSLLNVLNLASKEPMHMFGSPQPLDLQAGVTIPNPTHQLE